MLVFGHVASASLACHVLDRKADLRWVIFLTLLADIIDKPFGLIVFSETINNGRVWFHSLFVNLALTLVLVLCRDSTNYLRTFLSLESSNSALHILVSNDFFSSER